MTQIQGPLVCARYAVAPNYYGYCGPNENSALVDHLNDEIDDREVVHILTRFETLYPYLELIARINRIDDPLRRDVVEAYWIGNHLLHHIVPRDMYAFLQEKISIARVIEPKKLLRLKTKLFRLTFLPHHTFHVFNIFKRTGRAMGIHSVETMDACRINWGKIIHIIPRVGGSNEELVVKARPISIRNGIMGIDAPKQRIITNGYRRKTILKNISVGDTISFHWNFACDILSEKQVKHLDDITDRAIAYYNGPLA